MILSTKSESYLSKTSLIQAFYKS